GGPIRQLEAEVRGERYDGRVVDWQAGYGASTSATDPGEAHDVFAFPTRAAVVRKTRFARPQLLRQGLSLVGVIDQNVSPSQTGAVSNQGDAGVSITAITRGGPEDFLFDYLFLWRGASYTFDEIKMILPLRLRPGASLLIGGLYTAVHDAGGAASPDIGTLTFATNSPDSPTVVLTVTGVANAEGA